MNLLDDLPGFDWTDWLQASRHAVALLRRLAADIEGLGLLLSDLECDSDSVQYRESFLLDNQIELYDAMKDRGFRIGFNVTSPCKPENPHTHNFDFVMLMLRGTYSQTLYRWDQSTDAGGVRSSQPITVHCAKAGMEYCVHHTTMHSVAATPDSISLVLKGPELAKRSTIIDKESGKTSLYVPDEAGSHREASGTRDRKNWWLAHLKRYGVL